MLFIKEKFLRKAVCGLGIAFILITIISCGPKRQVVQNKLPLDHGVIVQPFASEEDVVLEDKVKLIIIHGSECGESIQSDPIVIEGRVDIPAYADTAAVYLNGWKLKYLKKDHEVWSINTRITNTSIDENQLKWRAGGHLFDQNLDDKFEWCYYYTALAWNQDEIDAATSGDDFNSFSDRIGLNETTALTTLPSYVQNSAFDQKKGIAVLPKGFEFGWSPKKDHHILQIAYNMDHSEAFIEADKGYDGLPPPSLPTDASRVDFGFVSWETYAIFKDNRAKRQYSFSEYFSAIGGDDVGVVQPPFSVRPREDSGIFGGGCIGEAQGVKTEEYVIENVPFEYALPMLTGWELGYSCDDEHVTEIGIWLHDIEYEKNPGLPAGTLRYKVSSILRDKDNSPGHHFRHKVSILGLKPIDQTPIPGERLPDLIPVKPHPEVPGPLGFCKRGPSGLIVTVNNQGDADAISSMTTVDFVIPAGGSIPVNVRTPDLDVGESVDLIFDIPAGCFDHDCKFMINVDSQKQIKEIDEGNNSADGLCVG